MFDEEMAIITVEAYARGGKVFVVRHTEDFIRHLDDIIRKLQENLEQTEL